MEMTRRRMLRMFGAAAIAVGAAVGGCLPELQWLGLSKPVFAQGGCNSVVGFCSAGTYCIIWYSPSGNPCECCNGGSGAHTFCCGEPPVNTYDGSFPEGACCDDPFHDFCFWNCCQCGCGCP